MKSVRSKVLIAVTLGSALVLASCNKGDSKSETPSSNQATSDEINELYKKIQELIANNNNSEEVVQDDKFKPIKDKVIPVNFAYFLGADDTKSEAIVTKCGIKDTENMKISGQCEDLTSIENKASITDKFKPRDILINENKAFILGAYEHKSGVGTITNNTAGIVTQCDIDNSGDLGNCQYTKLNNSNFDMLKYKNSKIFQNNLLILAKNKVGDRDIIRSCSIDKTNGLKVNPLDSSISGCKDYTIPESDLFPYIKKPSVSFDINKLGTIYVSQGADKRNFLKCSIPQFGSDLNCSSPVSGSLNTGIDASPYSIAILNNRIVQMHSGYVASYDIEKETYKNAVKIDDAVYFENKYFMDSVNINSIVFNNRLFMFGSDTSGVDAKNYKMAGTSCSFIDLTNTGINGTNKDTIEANIAGYCSYIFSPVSTLTSDGSNVSIMSKKAFKSVAFK
ncbi:hypothetical protein GCL60_12570 [Silvanigrella paludirubra]|uniref:Uncharacterized protein n=1 Tax=Silvanigrella paludirubra TaxID=2499159 RepID=A0A6N6VQY8_9BACT|nr:hypothetical protein [Silvanigrella paludirubra]KAB8037999.1 hypothetical protein GCL60_12570 [Silvanigrella paludirubra]